MNQVEPVDSASEYEQIVRETFTAALNGIFMPDRQLHVSVSRTYGQPLAADVILDCEWSTTEGHRAATARILVCLASFAQANRDTQLKITRAALQTSIKALRPVGLFDAAQSHSCCHVCDRGVGLGIEGVL